MTSESTPASPPSRASLALRLLSHVGLLAGSSWIAANVKGRSGAAPLVFLLALAVGLIAGFLAVQTTFRLGRSMRKGYDPAEISTPSTNLLWESVKTLGGLGAFALKVAVGFVLWSLLFVVFRRI